MWFRPVTCRSVLQAVLRAFGPNVRNPEEGPEDWYHAAHAESLPRNHITHPRPDVRQERPHAILPVRTDPDQLCFNKPTQSGSRVFLQPVTSPLSEHVILFLSFNLTWNTVSLT